MRHLLLLALCACSTPSQGWDLHETARERIGVGARVSAGAVRGDMSATLNVQKSRTRFETATDNVSGTGERIRIEGFKELAGGRLEIGAFMSSTDMDYAKTQDVGLSFRAFMGEAKLRPYVEIRAGYRDQTMPGTVPGSLEVVDSGGGWVGGLGVGAELELTKSLGAFLQIDLDYAEVDIGSAFTSTTTEIGVMLGGTVRF